jgi:hypothetical protein
MEPMTTEGEDKNEVGAINPFRQDFYHMGTRLGSNLVALFRNFDKDNCEYLILVNTITGERIEVNITNEKK